MGECLSLLCAAIIKHLRLGNSVKEKGLFWLIVLKAQEHGSNLGFC
jgi:hypothetical protein